MRTLYADPRGRFLHDLILDACRRFPARTAIIDTSAHRRLTYAEYGTLVEQLARGLVAAGLRSGEIIALFLPNSWEYCAAYHAATLAGAIPTPLNPSYREREVRYQLENSGAAFLIADAQLLAGIDLSGLPNLRRVFKSRASVSSVSSAPAATHAFDQRPANSQITNHKSEMEQLLTPTTASIPAPIHPPDELLAALPYSSGTTGLPKGVMLSHFNLVANAFQLLGIEHPVTAADVVLCFLPLYHIYGLNVVLNPTLTVGGTLLLMPRFDLSAALGLIAGERATIVPVVPPILNAFCQAAERGGFPRDHAVRWIKCGAAPLAPDLARRFTALTGIPLRQGYGMTEASPVTHVGCIDPGLYRPESVGLPVAETDCRVLDEGGREVAPGEPGELVMRGPQFMLGYWRAPDATAAVLRDGWYWSGDIVRSEPPTSAERAALQTLYPGHARAQGATVNQSTLDLSSRAERSGAEGPAFSSASSASPAVNAFQRETCNAKRETAVDLSSRAERSGAEGPAFSSASSAVSAFERETWFYVLDRRKEMIKYKGFSIAPAEIESVLLEHPAVRDCGVVSRPDPDSGEVPCAFIVLRDGHLPSDETRAGLLAFVAAQLTHYKQPRDIVFVPQIPHTPSGKILRRELRQLASSPAADCT